MNEVQAILNEFYLSPGFRFSVDRNYSQYSSSGYGKPTYYTFISEDTVIVSLRGTKLGYEVLIDGDIWIESIIYQVCLIVSRRE